MKKRTDNFDKFANQKKGSAVKEAFRQEKKKNPPTRCQRHERMQYDQEKRDT